MISNAAFTELRTLLNNGQAEKAKELLLLVQAGYFTLMEEIQHLQLRILNFEELMLVSKNVHRKNGLVWLDTAEGSKGPFCPLCHDTDHSLIRLEADGENWHCPSCQAQYPRHPHTRPGATVIPFRKTCQKLGL